MKKLIVIVVVIIVTIVIGYNYIYQDHRNIEKEQPTYRAEAKLLAEEFSATPAASEKKYLNQTIEVSGIITAISDNTITLDKTVYCQFSMNISGLQEHNRIQVKGRFIGYDDLLEEIKLDQCSISN
ncbi:OB-fold putative lipoprotein [Aestuariivivens sediminis]|uniref:OB-fold putative lipoprotein n=1 Tax=Aestuariivivens sediminis TaxID=2913557 RepID=UPI001F56B22D|nr:OB-fold putative lipoprotein [Aestuariivivens sediminis]